MPEWVRFHRGLGDLEGTQRRLLARILQSNADSRFGRAHGFPRGFWHLPVQDYAGWEGLTTEPVTLLEPTSGSSSASKLIPYTRGLQADFQRALAPWLGAHLAGDPALLGLRSYWSVTPLTDRPRRTEGGIPIGFADDSAYFGPLAWLVRQTQAVPPEVKLLADTQTFLRATREALAGCPDLGLISVWSPTFLLLLMEGLDPGLWPRLRCISCWCDGPSQAYAQRVRALFPGVRIAPKGLLATEGVVSIPYAGRTVLAYRSHFFEFETDDGQLLPAWKAEPGLEAGVVLTTSGGLYRYRLGDRVRLTGWLGTVPCLEFLGRTRVSDQVGEKLHEAFLRECLHGYEFALVVFAEEGYVLLWEGGEPPDLESRLRENFHYDYCRRLGQLRELRVVRVKDGWKRYLEGCRRRGRRLGDVKPTLLESGLGWLEDFSAGQ